MSDVRQCTECGATVKQDSLLGLCHKCQLASALLAAEPVSREFISAQPESGRQFGNYQLGEQLGRGGMGVVYEAFHVTLRRRVALKMILDSHGASPALRRRFAIEAEAAAKLDHPNIVPIYEVGEDDEQPYLSMKLVRGESLRKKMVTGEIGIAQNPEAVSKAESLKRQTEAVRLIAAVARAVQHAHEHGVLHRDLKPGNILLDADRQPHLTDFGLAKILDSPPTDGPQGPLTGSDCILGTPAYMSPEQAGNQRLTAASDVYSLGAILYELITGEPPFRGGTPLETIRMVTEQDPRHPSSIHPGIDSDLDTICLKSLEKKPESRYASARALAEDLERWLRREPIRARRAGVGARLARWVKRNPVGTSLIASLCVGLVLALVLLRMALERQYRLDVLRSNNSQKFSEDVEALWADPDKQFIAIHHSDLATLADLPLREPDGTTLKLTYALSVNRNPVAQALRWAPWLKMLEQKMEVILHRPVVFDLRMYKSNTDIEKKAVVRGDADFQKHSALTYLRAKRTQPGLQALAFEKREREAVIFVRKELGVTNLAKVIGLRAAFAHTNSIISFLAKVNLVRVGICAANLKESRDLERNTHLPEWVRSQTTSDAPGADTDFDAGVHKEVLKRVVANESDVGVCSRLYFEMNKHRGSGLVELYHYSIPYDIHVARAGLDPMIVEACRQSILSMNGRNARAVLAGLSRVAVSSFEPVTEGNFNELRSMETNELARFNGRLPADPPRNPND